jgi:lipopolysaccharide/colanic/teichoic acid biosynthesis glycosyltransferase
VKIKTNEILARHFEPSDLQKSVAKIVDADVENYILETLGDLEGKNVLLGTHRLNVIERAKPGDNDTYVDLDILGDLQNPNDLFRAINKCLKKGGYYVGCFAELKEKSSKNAAGVQHPSAGIDLRAQVSAANPAKRYSLAEVLGRLVFCGFEVIGYKQSLAATFYIVRKIGEPKGTEDPRYGFLMRMKRVGKNGDPIYIYKLRTMYPYSEYVQDFVVKSNGYNAYGKPDKDFRLISWGKFLRRTYIDEIPQLINFLKGDLNVVGLRPITEFALQSMSKEHQAKRLMYKPGLLPPHIALRKTGFEAVISAEKEYLEELGKHPLRTNLKFFFMAVFNIITFRTKSA